MIIVAVISSSSSSSSFSFSLVLVLEKRGDSRCSERNSAMYYSETMQIPEAIDRKKDTRQDN